MIEISGLIEYSTGVEYSTCDTPYNPFFQVFFNKTECIDVGFEISRYPFGVKTHLGVFFWKIMLIGRFFAGIGRI